MKKVLVTLFLVAILAMTTSVVHADPGGGVQPYGTHSDPGGGVQPE